MHQCDPMSDRRDQRIVYGRTRPSVSGRLGGLAEFVRENCLRIATDNWLPRSTRCRRWNQRLFSAARWTLESFHSPRLTTNVSNQQLKALTKTIAKLQRLPCHGSIQETYGSHVSECDCVTVILSNVQYVLRHVANEHESPNNNSMHRSGGRGFLKSTSTPRPGDHWSLN